MGLRDWLRRITGSKQTDPDEGEDVQAAPPVVSPAHAVPPRRVDGVDVAERLRAMPPGDAVRRAVASLRSEIDPVAATGLVRMLRELSARDDLDDDAGLLLAEYFQGRGEADVAARVLESAAKRSGDGALRARLGLADLCIERGDRDAAARWLEELVACDLSFPGARERLRRLGEGARPGDAGATLLAPDARAGIGRYVLLKELGRGGAGAVFLARDERLGREVAVKLHHGGGGNREARRARMRAEAEVAEAIRSARVVRLLDVRPEQGALVMEHCAGGSLRQVIARGPVATEQARGWIRDVALALARVHDAGWVHRDLKPGNILLRADGRAVVSDLGLARRAGELADAVEGTPGFTAPEARAGEAIRPTSDVYSFGAMGLALGLGGHPAVARLLQQCLSPDPAARPADGRALVTALSAIA
nr:serine/threonine protein kinase [Deltaproteobacteria bacterium]